MTTYRELLLGCGTRRNKDLRLPTAIEIANYHPGKPSGPVLGSDKFRAGLEWRGLVTLDIEPSHKPDLLVDLQSMWGHDGGARFRQLPISGAIPVIWNPPDSSCDEMHAYEVLEHIGAQGDHAMLFAQFTEFHRILKPGGLFYATCPSYKSMWAWGDPSHKRVITSGTLAFLSQRQYREQVGRTSMTDFRSIYKADFETLYVHEDEQSLCFVLRAMK